MTRYVWSGLCPHFDHTTDVCDDCKEAYLDAPKRVRSGFDFDRLEVVEDV